MAEHLRGSWGLMSSASKSSPSRTSCGRRSQRASAKWMGTEDSATLDAAMPQVSAQKLQLEGALVSRGWQVVEHGRPERAHWVFESWTIESVWAPLGLRLVLEFETDPMIQSEPGELRACSPGAVEGEQVASVFLRPKWERNLPRFIEELDRYRASVSRGVAKGGTVHR
jgi:hypothetical protein